jgi:drug/metabolite transporter (DMT)-like permease
MARRLAPAKRVGLSCPHFDATVEWRHPRKTPKNVVTRDGVRRVMSLVSWIWIPIVLAAAGAQTIRNASQRSLVKSAGTLAATFVRFAYGLPFAIIGLLALAALSPGPMPQPDALFFAWLALGAGAQLGATAFLIMAMEERSFVVAVAYSKTEILQIGLYSVVLLAEPLTTAAVGAIVLATSGVLLLSVKPGTERGTGIFTWFSPAALLGLASGAGFAFSAVGYRGAMLALAHPLPWIAGSYSLVWAQFFQTLLLGGYLLLRDRAGLTQVMIQWRVSTLAGLMGALASLGWLTAFAMRSAVDVRIVGLVEVMYSYALSRRLFKEPVSWREIAGIVLVAAGIVLISVAR